MSNSKTDIESKSKQGQKVEERALQFYTQQRAFKNDVIQRGGGGLSFYNRYKYDVGYQKLKNMCDIIYKCPKERSKTSTVIIGITAQRITEPFKLQTFTSSLFQMLNSDGIKDF